mgnify:CR=1 FL=1
MNSPIQYYNRHTDRIETEAVYGDGFLRGAYGNPLGRLTVALAVKRSWFSRWYGWRMDQPSSQARIDPFIRDYGLATAEFAEPVESFGSFNEFFYRKLAPGARPVDPDPEVAVLPADGRHLAIPNLEQVEEFYLKGQRFELRSFLADDSLAADFAGGSMLISRLCPVDYHRYHFPVAGTAAATVAIHGTLRSVNPLALRRDLSILWENKRVRTLIESPVFGKVVVMEVGATCVGSIHSTFAPGPVEKGQEKGYFSFGGSCLVTLFQSGRIRLDQDLLQYSAESTELYARVGERMGCA